MASTAIPIVPQTPELPIGSLPFSSTTTTTTPARPPPNPSPSPSPSQAQAHLYSPTKPPRTQPNAHPYAIKTTSTALLSRSNSNATNAQSTAHHYVPTSPSPSPSMSPSPSPTSPTRDAKDREFQPRATRHRYSRSLTSDMPMPLPPPPGTQAQKSSASYAIAPSHSTPGLANPYAYTYAQSQTANERQSSHRRASLSAGSSAENDDGDDDDTPRRKNRAHQHQRAETMPLPLPSLSLHASSSSSFDGLPEDPKTWTPAHLAVYVGLDGTANSGLMTKFVREKNLSGRAFLRLAETDLDSLPHATRASLLALSRGLRQKLVRAKIFGSNTNGTTDINQDDDDSFNNFNNDKGKHVPIGSLTRQHAIRPRRRSRVDSGASDCSSSSVSSFSSDVGPGDGDTPRTNARKRVRDRVDALEEKIGMMEEEGTASSSSASGLSSTAPTAGEGEGVNGTGAGKIRTKKSRMPQRGGVVSLFDQGPSTDSNPNNHNAQGAVDGNGKGPTTESVSLDANGGSRNAEVEDKDSTITHVARRNVNGREARMLPFPPVFPSVHQHHGIPTPATHEHLQSQPHPHYQSTRGMSSPGPGAADSPSVSDEYYGYEFGLRRAFGSAPGPGHLRATNGEDDDPHAGVYVVRHHPSSPRIVSGSHPGPGASVSAHNTGGSGGGETARKASPRLLPYPPVVGRAVLHHPRPRRLVGVGMGNETSDTGNEVWESALEDFGEGGVSGGTRDKEEVEEELSVQELLLREAEAASPEKKRTGKGVVPISGVDAWEMELGDTVKRVGEVREKEKKTADRHVEGGGGGGSVEIMRLFENANGSGDREDPTETQTRVDEVGMREDAVRVREDEVNARENGVRVREEGVKTLEESLKAKEEGVCLKEEDLCVREESVKTKEDSMRDREEDLRAREESVDKRLREVDERERAVGLREEEVERREVDVVQREEGVGQREEEVLDREREKEKRDMGTENEAVQTVLPPSTEDKAIDTSNIASNMDAASQTEDGDISGVKVNGRGTTTGTQPYLVSAWTVKRDWFLGRFRGIFAGARLGIVGVDPNAGVGVGGALVLMSLGVCAVVLRVLARKVLGGAAAHAAAGAGRR